MFNNDNKLMDIMLNINYLLMYYIYMTMSIYVLFLVNQIM